MHPDKNFIIEYNVCKARGQLVTYTKIEMCPSFLPSQICLAFVSVQTIALTIMKLCMRLHKYPLQSEFYGFLPPPEKYAFFGKKCVFHFFRSISKTIQLF